MPEYVASKLERIIAGESTRESTNLTILYLIGNQALKKQFTYLFYGKKLGRKSKRLKENILNNLSPSKLNFKLLSFFSKIPLISFHSDIYQNNISLHPTLSPTSYAT